ncbi:MULTISPECIES: MATE family efflux transporter [unclassified Sedimentibacter]|uniref:MATE family efflux transporter n=1 Tax=unclassified Sedimentibacter TaxID=2649220 RepID=UPI0027E0A7C8|nr:MATE family efflux transporter [Sedimentibacter sp. MB35-C1]WMJ76933.1 MATE family efflux transporter [Sedimentibacter sp. MB35-C1]
MKNKQFYQFVIPSIGAMLVTGLYFVVDGIFVGRGVGTEALAAINIAVPFISILTSVSMMITMGGATITSIHFGRGENEEANRSFRLSLVMVLIFSLIMTIVSFFFSKNLARLLGASDLLLEGAANYIKYFVLFGIFFCSSNTLSAFVRNDSNPRLAFWGMIIGAVSNVFLDWLFIFPLKMGLVGAAIASGLGQVLACLVLSTHFIHKKNNLTIGMPQFSMQIIGQIIKTGTPEFITQMSQPVIILCYNFIVLDIFGEIGVSAFSVISYILVVVIGVFTGLAQGIQPLLSRSFGEKDSESEKFFFCKGLRLNIFLATVIYGIMLLFGKGIISIFNSDSQLISLGYDCIKVYGICFLFAACNIVYTVYYLATKRTRQALIISVLRSFVANIAFIFLIPALFGVNTIWAGMIVAELVVLFVAMIISRLQRRVA